MTGRALAAALAALVLTGGVAAHPVAPARSMPSAKRVAPPDVPPLRTGALRIKVVPWAHDHGLGGNGGVIEAVDARSGERRWLLQVYRTALDPAMESDVQDVFITRLRLAGTGRIIVEDELRRRWLVDLASQAVTQQR
jgi:hypothetical protein